MEIPLRRYHGLNVGISLKIPLRGYHVLLGITVWDLLGISVESHMGGKGKAGEVGIDWSLGGGAGAT